MQIRFCEFFSFLSMAVIFPVEAYWQSSGTYTMERFCENSGGLLAVNSFPRKAPSEMFKWFLTISIVAIE